jgi:hypothetical protein
MATVAGMAAIALLVGATPSFAAPTPTPRADRTSTLLPLTLPQRPASGVVVKAAPAAAGTDTCATVRAKLPQYAAAGLRRVACTTVGPSPVRSATAAVVPNNAEFCDQIPDDEWGLNRTEACTHGHQIFESIIDPETGEIVGTANLTISQDILLQNTSGLFTENDSVTWVSATGVSLAGRTLTFTGACSDPCSTTIGTQTVPIRLGDTVRAAFVYEDAPGTRVDSFNTSNTFFWTVPPNVLAEGSLSWGGPGTIRCDAQFANLGPGCVFPEFTPILQLSLSIQGAGAANVAVGESFLPDGWGLSQPLTREADQSVQDSNRSAICDSTFIPTTFVPNDSCDEYAFAASQQSGAAFGLTGAACAEDVPFQANGQWVVQFFKRSGTERCLRGHVPSDQNSAVGSALGVLTRADRVLNAERYYVSVGP